MSDEPGDELLREDFRALREEVERSGGVPDFASMMARARADAAPNLTVADGSAPAERGRPDGAGRRFALAGWATAAVAAAVAALLMTTRGPDSDADFERLVAAYSADASAGAWRSPTSSLLEAPGMGLTRAMPSIGSSLRGVDPALLEPLDPNGGAS